MASGWASNDGSAQFPDGTTQGPTRERLCGGTSAMTNRQCTCHPTDRPPLCQHRYAASECKDAWREFVIRGGEAAGAVVLADRLLDAPNADPDDDLRMLSRQLMRAHERIAALSAKPSPDGAPSMPSSDEPIGRMKVTRAEWEALQARVATLESELRQVRRNTLMELETGSVLTSVIVPQILTHLKLKGVHGVHGLLPADDSFPSSVC